MTHDQPTESDAVAETSTSSPAPTTRQHRSGRRGRGEIVMTHLRYNVSHLPRELIAALGESVADGRNVGTLL